ncbi:EF-hand calcium-binding domain-containing protein 1 [Folsomia candida]|uniref:EF-hand calcium-binding domain-containing protein 1 n=2 Tax=Folsomia candida TaxID=158441 RepID=A0A226DDN3_FOLCA|nr:EF-hand calcium-binding domain-containing protein 1 [Folsomia candida]
MLDLCYKAFDRDNDGVVDDAEWTRGLSAMIRGSLEELVEFVYFVYDMNGDRSLAREELYHCLRGCMHPGYGIDADELEECEREIVEIAMKKLDVDRDGQITFPDFQNAVITDPLLLQACGPCLPSPKSTASFLALITLKYRSYTGVWAVQWNQAVEGHHSKRKSHVARARSHSFIRSSISTASTLASLAQSKMAMKGGGGASSPLTIKDAAAAKP